MSATLVMEPASFKDPSTLYTGIGWDKFWVGILVRSTKPSLMKSPVAPQSTRASIPTSSSVSVVLRCTGIKIELGPCSSDQMTSLEASFFSYLGQRGRAGARIDCASSSFLAGSITSGILCI